MKARHDRDVCCAWWHNQEPHQQETRNLNSSKQISLRKYNINFDCDFMSEDFCFAHDVSVAPSLVVWLFFLLLVTFHPSVHSEESWRDTRRTMMGSGTSGNFTSFNLWLLACTLCDFSLSSCSSLTHRPSAFLLWSPLSLLPKVDGEKTFDEEK